MRYRYETHLHTCQASKCGRSTGAEHARHYKALGYDGIFVTDHFFRGNCAVPQELPWAERVRLFCAGYEDARREGERIGLKVFFGWEETFDGDDYLVYGLSPAWLAAHPELDSCTRGEQLALVHAGGGCVVQAHPFRRRGYIPRILLGRDYADAVEVANAGNAQEDDVCALAYARAFGLMMTCGSDNHLAGKPQDEIWGVALDAPLESARDYVSVLLMHRPLELLCPAARLLPPGGMDIPACFFLDGSENPVPADASWLRDLV